MIMSVFSKAFISPSVLSVDNLKSLWCIYLGSGLLKRVTNPSRRVCQMPAGEPAASRLHGEREGPDRGLSAEGPVGGALVWLLTCKWAEGPRRILPEPRAVLPSTQSPAQGGWRLRPVRHPASRLRRWAPDQRCCETSVGTVPVAWEFPQVHAWGCSLCMSVNRGSMKVFEMKKNTKWWLIGFGLSKIIFAHRHVHIQNSMVDPSFQVLSEFCLRFLWHCLWHHVSIAPGPSPPLSLSCL